MGAPDNPVNLDTLIHLLDDPDAVVYMHVHDDILAMGIEAVDALEEAWFGTSDQLIRSRIEDLVKEIQSGSIYQELADWAAGGSDDLLRGFLIVTRFQYPNLDTGKLLTDMDKLFRSIWIEMNDKFTSLEKVKVLNHMLFKVHKFDIEDPKTVMPEHFFLNNLLQNKTGNALSLGMLYLILAGKLQMPVRGVDLPYNFIVAYTHSPDELTNDFHPVSEVKFYINPAAKGAVFSRKEINIYLEEIGVEPRDSYFRPALNIDILQCWCKNLAAVYTEKGMPAKAREMKRLLALLR